jgi:translation initiation factor 1
MSVNPRGPLRCTRKFIRTPPAYDRRMPGLFHGTPLEQPVTCPRCSKPYAAKTPAGVCACPRGADGKVLDPADQPIRVRRETGGRGGKTVTSASGFAKRSRSTTDLDDLLKSLKAKLGTGGSLALDKDHYPVLELQGDHRDKLVELLKALGYPAKPAGG